MPEQLNIQLGTRNLKEMGGLGKINACNISNLICCINVNFRNTSV